MSLAIESIVDKAVKDNAPPPPAEGQPKDTKQEETPKEPADKKVAPKEEALTEEQQKEATQLYKLLGNKETAPGVIDWLARQAGYTKADLAKVDTKEDVKEVKDDILDTLKESLGPEMEFLADKLSPAINKILEKKLGEHTKDIRETIQAAELEKTSAVADTVLTNLSKEYFGKDEPPADIISRINELIDEMPPSEGLTADKYMKNLFNIAVSEKGLVKKAATNTRGNENANKNRTDAATRLASERAASGQIPVTVPKARMSLTDSIKSAIETVNAAAGKE